MKLFSKRHSLATPALEDEDALRPVSRMLPPRDALGMDAEAPPVARSRRPSHSRPIASAPVQADPDTGAPVQPRRIWAMEDKAAADPTMEEPDSNGDHHAAPVEPEPAAPPAEDVSAEDVAQARALIAQMSAVAPIPEPPSPETPTAVPNDVDPGDRAKTRVLGFRATELAAEDPFVKGGRGNQARGPDYPVGWMLVVEGPGTGASFALTNGVSSIGRGDDQTICLAFGDGAISRQNHASVAYDEETRTFFLGHGGKSNIVRLNDRPVLSTEDLVSGDRIRLGETTMLFVGLCDQTFDWSDCDGATP